MKKEFTVILTIGMGYDGLPADLYSFLRKEEKIINSAFVPQTLGDCVWFFFEFANKEDKEGFEEKLNLNNADITEKFTQKEINHWIK